MSNIHRTALITGGLGDLGTEISRALFDAGCSVLVTYFESVENPQDWLAARAAEGRRFRAYGVDVSNFDACARCAERIRAEVGSVDILINNAGITRDVTFMRMEKSDWDAVLRTDLDSVFNMTRPFCEHMAQQGWGRIVNIASVNASRGAYGQTNYSAAKAGIHGFTKSLALEVARKGVTVNTVSPGYLESRMVAQVPEAILKEKVLPQIPVGRLGRPKEVASLIAYLCTDDAAFITGANLAVNGGQHMQ